MPVLIPEVLLIEYIMFVIIQINILIGHFLPLEELYATLIT